MSDAYARSKAARSKASRQKRAAQLAARPDLTPGSPDWLRRITASKVAAILGVSTWDSPRSIWHKMHGDLPPENPTAAQARGHYLEPGILAWWRDQHPEYDGWIDQPVYTLGDWGAATPDALANSAEHPPVLVEAKSDAEGEWGEWGDAGTDAIPAHYLCQTYWQMHVSGIHRCYVPLLGPRLRFTEYVVDYDPAIGADLEARMAAFYATLTADEPPPLDDTVATYDAVRKIHPDIEPGAVVELTRDEAHDFAAAMHAEATSAAAARYQRSYVVDRLGRAQYAEHAGVRVARRQPRGDATAFVPIAKDPTQFAQEAPCQK